MTQTITTQTITGQAGSFSLAATIQQSMVNFTINDKSFRVRHNRFLKLVDAFKNRAHTTDVGPMTGDRMGIFTFTVLNSERPFFSEFLERVRENIPGQGGI